MTASKDAYHDPTVPLVHSVHPVHSMTDPTDDIPIPGEPVLSEEETSRQLRHDYCRQYIEEADRWKARAESAEQELCQAIALLALARDAFLDISANLTQPPIPLRSGHTAAQLADMCERFIREEGALILETKHSSS